MSVVDIIKNQRYIVGWNQRTLTFLPSSCPTPHPQTSANCLSLVSVGVHRDWIPDPDKNHTLLSAIGFEVV